MYAHDWHAEYPHKKPVVQCLKCREHKTREALAFGCKQQKGMSRPRRGPSGIIRSPQPVRRELAAPHGLITHWIMDSLHRIDLRTRVQEEAARKDVPHGKHAIAKRLGISWRRVTSLLAVPA